MYAGAQSSQHTAPGPPGRDAHRWLEKLTYLSPLQSLSQEATWCIASKGTVTIKIVKLCVGPSTYYMIIAHALEAPLSTRQLLFPNK